MNRFYTLLTLVFSSPIVTMELRTTPPQSPSQLHQDLCNYKRKSSRSSREKFLNHLDRIPSPASTPSPTRMRRRSNKLSSRQDARPHVDFLELPRKEQEEYLQKNQQSYVSDKNK